MVFFILLFSFFASAGEVRLEPGETVAVPPGTTRIWIENKNSIQAQSGPNGAFLKAVAPGRSTVRLGRKLLQFAVMQNGARSTLETWQVLAKNLAGVKAGYCFDRVCLTGNIYRLRDFERIVQWMSQHNSRLFLSLNAEIPLQKQIGRAIDVRLREGGFTPQKVIFSTPWKIYLPSNAKAARAAEHLGLLPVQFQRAVDLADNVKVSVKIMELSRSFERKLGVRWPDSFQGQIVNGSRFETPAAFDVAINAAEKSGEARLLASPNVICRSGKEAEFFAGGEIPVKVLNLRSSTVSWKRYGIGLKLKPLVDAVGAMSLQIETEVSSIDRSVAVDDLPAFHVSRVSSFFDLVDRRTIALSGLLKTEKGENTEGLPFLQSLPVLGALFRSKNFQNNKSELIIFVTPELLTQGED